MDTSSFVTGQPTFPYWSHPGQRKLLCPKCAFNYSYTPERWNKERHLSIFEIDRVGRHLGQPEDIMTFASPSVTKQAINRVSSFVNLEGDLTVNGSTSAYGTSRPAFGMNISLQPKLCHGLALHTVFPDARSVFHIDTRGPRTKFWKSRSVNFGDHQQAILVLWTSCTP